MNVVCADHPVFRLAMTLVRANLLVENEADPPSETSILELRAELQEVHVLAEAWATPERREALAWLASPRRAAAAGPTVSAVWQFITLAHLSSAATATTRPRGVDAAVLRCIRSFFPNGKPLGHRYESDTELALFLSKVLLKVLCEIPIKESRQSARCLARAIREILVCSPFESGGYRIGDPTSPTCQLLNDLAKVTPEDATESRHDLATHEDLARLMRELGETVQGPEGRLLDGEALRGRMRRAKAKRDSTSLYGRLAALKDGRSGTFPREKAFRLIREHGGKGLNEVRKVARIGAEMRAAKKALRAAQADSAATDASPTGLLDRVVRPRTTPDKKLDRPRRRQTAPRRERPRENPS